MVCLKMPTRYLKNRKQCVKIFYLTLISRGQFWDLFFLMFLWTTFFTWFWKMSSIFTPMTTRYHCKMSKTLSISIRSFSDNHMMANPDKFQAVAIGRKKTLLLTLMVMIFWHFCNESKQQQKSRRASRLEGLYVS